MPKKLLFATKQLHRNLHKATESNHFKLKSLELEAFNCTSSASNESFHRTYDIAVAHEQPPRKELCFQGLCRQLTDCHTSRIICSGYSSKGRLNKPQMAKETTIHPWSNCMIHPRMFFPIRCHSPFIKEGWFQEPGHAKGWSCELQVPSPFPVITTDQQRSLKHLWSN